MGLFKINGRIIKTKNKVNALRELNKVHNQEGVGMALESLIIGITQFDLSIVSEYIYHAQVSGNNKISLLDIDNALFEMSDEELEDVLKEVVRDLDNSALVKKRLQVTEGTFSNMLEVWKEKVNFNMEPAKTESK